MNDYSLLILEQFLEGNHETLEGLIRFELFGCFFGVFKSLEVYTVGLFRSKGFVVIFVIFLMKGRP